MPLVLGEWIDSDPLARMTERETAKRAAADIQHGLSSAVQPYVGEHARVRRMIAALVTIAWRFAVGNLTGIGVRSEIQFVIRLYFGPGVVVDAPALRPALIARPVHAQDSPNARFQPAGDEFHESSPTAAACSAAIRTKNRVAARGRNGGATLGFVSSSKWCRM